MADSPRLTPAKQAEHAARTERLARALRDNLRRRKEQSRAAERSPASDPLAERDDDPAA